MYHALRSRKRHRASLERAQADPSPRDDILRYETTWIGTASSPPLFDNASWNQNDSSLMLLLRSSDIADGWNTASLHLSAAEIQLYGAFSNALRRIKSSRISQLDFLYCIFFLNIYNIDLIKVLLVNLIVDYKSVSDRVRKPDSITNIVVGYHN